MAQNVADYIIERLHSWGVRRIYGFPGDGINGFMGALNKAEGTDHALEFIQARHEEEAAFMAAAHSKWLGGADAASTGVCMATSGPGAIHLLNGLYDAHMDHVPAVAIVGQQARQGLGAYFQQEVDLTNLYKDVAHEYVQQASVAPQVRHLVDEALRIAIARRAVTCIIVPNDLQSAPYSEPPRKHGSTFSGIGYSRPRVVPMEEDLRRAAAALNAGKKVAILIGAGAKGAADEVQQVAETLGAGVAKALLGKDVLPDTLPFVTGGIGLLGTKPSWDLMMDCDTFFMIGSSFPYAEFLPKEGQARGVQIDIEARSLGLRYPMEVNLHGDAKETLQALLPMLHRNEDRSWQDTIRNNIKEWYATEDDRASHEADPINPQYVFHELNKRLPERVVLSADSGSASNWYSRYLKMRPGMRGSLSGNLATMCPGVPYLLAAKFCFPDRPAIACVGDGAMQMLGNDGIITMSKYWKEWSDPRAIILVINNRDLNQVTWEQRIMEGDPRYDASQSVPDFDYDKLAESVGLIGLRMEKKEDVPRVWDEAMRARRPVVINAYTDPEVATLPPHITFKQAKSFAMSLPGDNDPVHEAVTSMKGVASEVVGKFSK